jgi:ornithine cyclodeaminase
MIEVPPDTVGRASVFVDSVEAVMEEAGELVAAINGKLLFPTEMTELGAVLNGQATGRETDEQITFFKSVGVAVQDAMAAQLALDYAKKLGLGQEIDW